MVNGGPSLWLRRDIDAHIEKRRRSRTKPRPTVGNLKQYGRCGTCKAAQASVTSTKRKPLAGLRAARG
jgi:hypothetical protein